MKVKAELKITDELINQRKQEICELKEKLAEIEKENKTRADCETYSVEARTAVYVNHEPVQMQNVPTLIQSSAKQGESVAPIHHIEQL